MAQLTQKNWSRYLAGSLGFASGHWKPVILPSPDRSRDQFPCRSGYDNNDLKDFSDATNGNSFGASIQLFMGLAFHIKSSPISTLYLRFSTFDLMITDQSSEVITTSLNVFSNCILLLLQVVNSCRFIGSRLTFNRNSPRQNVLCATSQDQAHYSELKSDAFEPEDHDSTDEILSPTSSSFNHFQGTDGKPGLVSFYNHPYKIQDEAIKSNVQKNQSSLLWFMGPAVLVASFIFPSLYLRRILSSVFEDSLLTDFLILFFTEALFYCGVAVFLLLIDHLRRPMEPESIENGGTTLTPQLEQRISSVAALVLSLIIPLVTMGLVWPWTGPAASATLAPYLVGIIVQFAFEQYARYRKSPSWPVIPIIFQVYRLHQLNRAVQLVTALSFTVRGAEMTSHNLEISSSLGTLLNVLQFLGVICIWSLSSFLMKFYPSTARTAE